jgi:hypothetical protein
MLARGHETGTTPVVYLLYLTAQVHDTGEVLSASTWKGGGVSWV